MTFSGIHISPYLIIFIVIFTLRNFVEFFLIPKPAAKGRGTGSLVLFYVLYLVLAISVAWHLLTDVSVNVLSFIFGLLIFVLFHIFRLISVRKMGRSYSQAVAPTDQGGLITTGFYSVIRHPIYLFYVLEMTGLMMVKFNYIALCAVLIDLVVTLYRIRDEEALLIQKYGDNYLAYKAKTRKLIPYIC